MAFLLLILLLATAVPSVSFVANHLTTTRATIQPPIPHPVSAGGGVLSLEWRGLPPPPSGRLSLGPIRMSVEDEDEDDGWGSSASDNGMRELASLRSERSERRQRQVSSSSYSSTTEDRADEAERDLFIPIFAVVSLLGLFGSYAYEMARLYSRGELYLPWEQ